MEAGEKAIDLTPNSSDAYHMAGMYHGYACNFRKVVMYEEYAQQLSPIERNESMVDEARARFHLRFRDGMRHRFPVREEKPRRLTAQSNS